MKVSVFAKLNLSLNVFPKQGDFHPVDSVVVSLGLWDNVNVTRRKDKIVTLRGYKKIPVEQNSAYRAAVAFVERFDTCGCNIKLKKNIPVGAGLGGSSADAAAVVACLCRLYDVEKTDERVHELCAQLGSDINFMLFGGLARTRGKGDDLQFCENYPRMFFAVTFFDAQFSSAEVYRHFDESGENGVLCSNEDILQSLEKQNAREAFELLANGLQNAAVSRADDATQAEIQRYLEVCSQRGYKPHMTGSGSAFFIPFATKEQADIATKFLKWEKFNTRSLPFSAWGVQTRELLFRIV